jgi:hypothetical protein
MHNISTIFQNKCPKLFLKRKKYFKKREETIRVHGMR